MALKRHKHHIGPRYIEVYRAGGDDFLAVAGGATCEAAAFLSRDAQVIVRMRGLPYDATPQQVLDFFSGGDDPVSVVDGADGVLFVRRADGRATGDAFVLFAHEADAPRALARHRRLIGARYIELFRSTIAEVQQVLNRSLERSGGAGGGAGGGGAAGGAGGAAAAEVVPVMLPQHVITSGTAKDCVRLRGLPYEAKVEHILTFLDEFAKNIVVQGVHMVYNAQGHPSGEAFIQMDSETSAFLCAQQKHHRYMTFGKKQRYIEVFQCSGDDMNLVLTGGAAAPGVVAAPKVLSPGMCPPRLLAHSIAQHNLLARQHESLLLSLRSPYLPMPVRAQSPYLPAMPAPAMQSALPAKRTYERAFAGAEAPPAKRPYPVAAPLPLPMPVFSYASPVFTSSAPAFSYGVQAGLPPLPGYASMSSPFPAQLPHLPLFPTYPYYPGV